MKPVRTLAAAVAVCVCVAAATTFTAGRANDGGRPTNTLAIPAGYRQWQLVGVAHEAGDLDDLRAILGNAVAMKALREGALPLPDGAIIARLAWKMTLSAENDAVFGRPQSYVPGAPTEVFNS